MTEVGRPPAPSPPRPVHDESTRARGVEIDVRELPLERTLDSAARLRLPDGTPGRDLHAASARVLAALDLGDRAGVRVGSLSGGQRKRSSIGVELLTDPAVFFLDEPSSGLDPT